MLIVDNPNLHFKVPKDSTRKLLDFNVFCIVFLKIELPCDLVNQFIGVHPKYSVLI